MKPEGIIKEVTVTVGASLPLSLYITLEEIAKAERVSTPTISRAFIVRGIKAYLEEAKAKGGRI